MRLPVILMCLLSLVLLSFTGFAFAQETVPELGSSVVALIESFKNGAVPAAIIIAVVQLLKTEFVSSSIGKINSGVAPLLVVILGLVSGVLTSMASGSTWTEGAIQGLFNGGYAMSIYSVIVKHFTAKD